MHPSTTIHTTNTARYRADFAHALATTNVALRLSGVRENQLFDAILRHPDARDILADPQYAGMLLTENPPEVERYCFDVAANEHVFDSLGFLLGTGASWVAYRASRPDRNAVYLGFFRLTD